MQNNKNILLIGGYNSLLGSKIYFYSVKSIKFLEPAEQETLD